MLKQTIILSLVASTFAIQLKALLESKVTLNAELSSMIFTTADLLKGKPATQSSDGQGTNGAAGHATDGIKSCSWQQSENHLS
jgi:hypothetical protein